MFLTSPDIWMEFEIFPLKLFRLIIKANWADAIQQMRAHHEAKTSQLSSVLSSRDDSTLLDDDKWKNKHFYITVN